MMTLLAVLVLCVVLLYLVLPWVNRSKIKKLQGEIAQLQRDIAELRMKSEKPVDDSAAQFQIVEDESEPAWGGSPAEHAAPGPAVPIAPAAATSEGDGLNQEQAKSPELHGTQTADLASKRSEGFEHQFGGRAFVWLGAVALAFAGFYLVKYSIEAGLLSPPVRVTMGIIFGIALLYTGNRIRVKPDFANGVRIAQALSGAGIAVLYASFYAATSLYDLIPPLAGLAGMAVTTATAVALSTWHGRPIALLGLLGGLLTPALIRSPHPQASILFTYLLLVLAGLMAVIRFRGWWSLGIPALLGAWLWVPVWLYAGNFKPADTLWLGLFLLSAEAIVVVLSRRQYEEDFTGIAGLFKVTSALNHLAICGAIALMGLTAERAGFGNIEWGLFGLLAAGAIALACSNQKLYALAPWTSAAVNSVMLVLWQYDTAQEFALILCCFAALHVAGAYYLQLRSRAPLIWGGLTGAAALGYYLIAYFKIQSNPLHADIPLLWGLLALMLAAMATYAVLQLAKQPSDDFPRKQHLLALYTALIAAFFSIGLTIELKREFLSVAIAAEVLAVAWINTKADIRALRWIGALLACVFGFLLIPQMILVAQLTAYSLVEAKLYLQKSIPIVNWPLFQLGLPALCFMAAGYLLRKEKDDRLVFSLEAAAIGLFGLMGYYLTRNLFHLDENVLFVKPGFVERGVITNIFFIYGLLCLWAGNKFTRRAISLGGLVLAAVALFRISYFDLILYNPVWSAQKVGELPIINGLLLPYGIPILFISIGMKQTPPFWKTGWNKYGYGFMLMLAFVLVSLNVRQFFQGSRLDMIEPGSAEIYAYSVVWLLFGIGVLFLGTLRRDKMIRIASMPIILLTVSKVFLYDASALSGLWRVFSFFCLGLSLLAVSWFYSRFVFNEDRR
ncbi:MAG: DUF2339 domain-containing protein [Syntrophobacteraceae bacterium]